MGWFFQRLVYGGVLPPPHSLRQAQGCGFPHTQVAKRTAPSLQSQPKRPHDHPDIANYFMLAVVIDIFEYIKKDNPAAAISQLERFDTSVSRLALNPLLGVIPRDERLRRLGYRMLIVDMYLVFYVVKTKTVQIRRIIHGARRYSFLL